MKLRTLAGTLLVLGVFLAEPVAAQDPSPTDTRLQMETQRKRMVVRPPVVSEQARRDAGRVTADLEAEARREELIRELNAPRPRFPSRDYDITSGIQGRNLQNARRR